MKATPPIKFLRMDEVEARTGIKRDSIYRLAKTGDFPKSVKVSERATAWVESEIDAYVASRIALRDGGKRSGAASR